uniref:Uncharacterized protein n=1 Tax=Moniliophthora roreri TaxID=221103 RepID=A0A0W0FAX9_MONRR
MNAMSSHSTASVVDHFLGLQDVIVESEWLAQPATILEDACMLCNPLDNDNNVPNLVEAHDSDNEFSDEDDKKYDVPLPHHSLYEPPLHSSAFIQLQPSKGTYVNDEDVVMGEVLEDVREAKKTVKELAQNMAFDTKSTYKSIIKKAEKFFQNHKILRPGKEFICKNPQVDALQLAVLVIMHL